MTTEIMYDELEYSVSYYSVMAGSPIRNKKYRYSLKLCVF